MTTQAILICEETAVSVELFRFTSGTQDPIIEQIKVLWFEGAPTEMPVSQMTTSRSIKFSFAELTNIYYCFDFCVWEEGSFFCDIFSGRTVLVPEALADEIMGSIENKV